MRAKEKPFMCDRSPNLTHTNGGARDTQGRIASSGLSSVIIAKIGVFFKHFLCQRRLLSLVSHIACIALGGIIGNILFTRYGTAMFLPLVIFGVFALSQWLLLRLEVGGGK